MALQTSEQWNINIQKDTTTPSPPKKASTVQQRLESYKSHPPSPSVDLENKQLAASEARTKAHDERALKIQEKTSKNVERRRRMSGEFDEKVNKLKEESVKKEERATTAVKDLESKRVQALKERNGKVIEAGSSALKSHVDKVQSLKEENAKKEERATTAVKDLENKRVQALKERNDKVIEAGSSALKSHVDKVQSLKEESVKKEERATTAVKDLEDKKVQALKERNDKVIEAGSSALKSLNDKVQSLKLDTEKKVSNATIVKETLEDSRVKMVGSYNRLVAEKALLAREDAAALIAANEQKALLMMKRAEEGRDLEVLSRAVNAAAHNDLVNSKCQLVRATEALTNFTKMEELDYKVKSAGFVREEKQMEMVMGLSRKNQEVFERGSAVKAKRGEVEAKKVEENEIKMMESSIRRDRIIEDKVLKAKMHSNRSPEASPAKEGGAHQQLGGSVTKEDIEQRLENATVRRSAIIDHKVTKALSFSSPAPKKKTVGGSPSADDENSSSESPSSKLDVINTRLDDAAARREVLLLQKSEMAGMNNLRAKEVATKSKLSPKKSATTIGFDGSSIEGKRLHCDDEGLETGHEVRDIEPSTTESAEAVSVQDVSLDMGLNEEKPVDESLNDDVGKGNCTAA